MVCVIIVAHNNGNTLRMALKSLLDCDDVDEIIIVDNNSMDDTRTIIDEFANENPKLIKRLYLEKNYGFATAVNMGVKACRNPKPYFALLNPDAIATREWLRKLIEFMDKTNDAGMAQSLLIKPNGDIDSAGGFINGLGYPLELSLRGNLSILTKLKPYEVGYAKGAAVLIRYDAYAQVGGFDNRFFFYYDEADLSYRMRKVGWKSYVVPNSIVYHIGLGSRIPHKDLFVLYHMERNHLLFLWKNLRSRFIPALFWSLMGAIHERKSYRLRLRLKAIYDAVKLIIKR